jgi:opacity protein-like surface antigen
LPTLPTRITARPGRGDLTYDHRFKSDLSGYRFDTAQLIGPTGGDCDAAPAGFQSSCYGTRSFGLKSDVFLANMYFDFDCRCHITPYLGVGLGVVRHKTTAGVVTNANGVVGDIEGASNTHVAAALMGGFSMQLRERVSLDAGYRFLYLGDAVTGAIKDRVGAVQIAPDPSIEAIHAHEFRVGLRYDFR